MIRNLKVLVICGMGFFLRLEAEASPLKLVDNKRNKPCSAYSIYLEKTAPESNKLAAEELQRVIEISTKVKLPIIHMPKQPMICLGSNPSAKKAGVSAGDLPDEGFHIVTKNGNIYIVGNDTPDNQPTWKDWESAGTFFGACEFLERVVGARWLMPGEWGEDIPQKTTLDVPSMAITESPDFSLRCLANIQQGMRGKDTNPLKVFTWIRRQKLFYGKSTYRFLHKLSCGHAWRKYGMPEVLKAHPEYEGLGSSKYKFCTSKRAAVKAYADGVIKWLDENPSSLSAAISPEDGGNFCRCKKCNKLRARDPYENESVTLLILKFYNDVAKIVAKKHPDRMLGGIVYYNYKYPPKRQIKIEPNLFLVMANINHYGWGLAKPVYRDEFPTVTAGWLKLTKQFYLWSFSTWMRNTIGAPVPPGLEILKLEVPTLKRLGGKGVIAVGNSGWGHGGPGNYIYARQLWDADIDVEKTFSEWLQRAYGPAWKTMDRFYRLLDERFYEYKNRETTKYSGSQYELNYKKVINIYKPVFPELEQLYRTALSQASTVSQKKRLEMLGDNMIMFHHNLSRAKMVPDPEKSIFYRSDKDYSQFINDTEFSLSIARDHGQRNISGIYYGSFSGQGESPPMEQRTLIVPRIAKGTAVPVIDGDLSDGIWKMAGAADQFRLVGGKEKARQQTEARAAYDQKNLYLSFRCLAREPEKVIKKTGDNEFATFWSYDLVEVMLATFPDAKERFWHLALNAIGAQWDGIVSDASEDLSWHSAVKVGPDFWSAEMAIPLENLGIKDSLGGKKIRANFARSEKPAKENSTWNSVYKRFMEVYSFGDLNFVEGVL